MMETKNTRETEVQAWRWMIFKDGDIYLALNLDYLWRQC